MSRSPSTPALQTPSEGLAQQFWRLPNEMRPLPSHCREPIAVVGRAVSILRSLERSRAGHPDSLSTRFFARLLGDDLDHLSYAAPEQIRGAPVDQHSMVFTIGVLLFERLTGRHPFGKRASESRVERLCKGELGSGVNYFPVVPDALRKVLMTAMAPFSQDRWGSLADFRTSLEVYLSGQHRPRPLPGTAPPSSHTEPTRVVRMATQFARELTEAVAQHDRSQRPTPPASLPGIGAADRPSAPAQPSTSRPSPREAPSAAVTPPAPTAKVIAAAPGAELVSLRPDRRRLVYALYVALGAAVATAVFALSWPAEPAGTTDTVAADVAAATITEPAEPEPIITAVPESEPEPEPPAVFDAELGGTNAAAAARSCFDRQRLSHGVWFGLGIVFGADSGAATKLYHSGRGDITPPEWRCLKKNVIGVSAGAGLGERVVVDYRFHLTASRATAVAQSGPKR